MLHSIVKAQTCKFYHRSPDVQTVKKEIALKAVQKSEPTPCWKRCNLMTVKGIRNHLGESTGKRRSFANRARHLLCLASWLLAAHCVNRWIPRTKLQLLQGNSIADVPCKESQTAHREERTYLLVASQLPWLIVPTLESSSSERIPTQLPRPLTLQYLSVNTLEIPACVGLQLEGLKGLLHGCVGAGGQVSKFTGIFVKVE